MVVFNFLPHIKLNTQSPTIAYAQNRENMLWAPPNSELNQRVNKQLSA